MQTHDFVRKAIPEIKRDLIEIKSDNAEFGLFIERVIKETSSAIKFVLPENGKIFDTQYKGLPDHGRLPFDKIVIEYTVDNEVGLVKKVFEDKYITTAKKRIVLAEQFEDDIYVSSIVGFQMYGKDVWQVQHYFAKISPTDTVPDDAEINDFGDEGDGTIEKYLIGVFDVGGMSEQRFGDEWVKHVYYNIMDECNAVMALIEALTCTNVETEIIPGKKNKLAQRKGALPFDDYRVLVLKNQVAAVGGGFGGSHRSPREHLRRGHIRRLPKGNIWINSMIVNAGIGGRLIKDYAIEKQARSA